MSLDVLWRLIPWLSGMVGDNSVIEQPCPSLAAQAINGVNELPCFWGLFTTKWQSLHLIHIQSEKTVAHPRQDGSQIWGKAKGDIIRKGWKCVNLNIICI